MSAPEAEALSARY